MRLERRKELSHLLKTELQNREITLTPQQFNDLLRYAKENNKVGDGLYNCEYLYITIEVWLTKKHLEVKNDT